MQARAESKSMNRDLINQHKGWGAAVTLILVFHYICIYYVIMSSYRTIILNQKYEQRPGWLVRWVGRSCDPDLSSETALHYFLLCALCFEPPWTLS